MTSRFGKSYSGFGGKKNDKEKFLFIASAGAALALVLIFIGVASLKSTKGRGVEVADDFNDASSQSVATVALLAPEKDVPSGQKLDKVKFKRVYWPKAQIPDGSFQDPAEVAKLFARVKLPAGIPIQNSNTTSEPPAPEVTMIKLTPGNRAVTIDVDDTSGLEGHALPGTHVDVVLTSSGADALMSSIIVQNARVLSYGGDSTPASSLVKQAQVVAKVKRTITLDVAIQDALKIQTARQMGRLSLIMRAANDDAAASTTQVSGQEVSQSMGGVKHAGPNIACSRGKMRMGGRDYIVGCDGSMNPVEEEK